MADPNPYESPTSSEPIRPARAAKRAIGVTMILLFTPLAMIIALAGGCAASRMLSGISPILFSMFAPFVILTGLMCWAAGVHRIQQRGSQRSLKRIALMLVTPIVVAVAAVAGYFLGALVVFTASEGSGGLSVTGMWIGLALFLLVPSLALLGMLWAAWRAD